MSKARKGFTLVEILIVVVILGILAAIVIPQFTNASESARASSLISQLQSIRSQLELYQVQHNGTYPDLSTDWTPMTEYTEIDGTVHATKPANNSPVVYGPYLQQAPVNPFENSSTVSQADPLPAGVAGTGWVYDNTNGQVKGVIAATKATEVNLTNTNDIATY